MRSTRGTGSVSIIVGGPKRRGAEAEHAESAIEAGSGEAAMDAKDSPASPTSLG
jgi:hypothetical protein